MPDARCQMPDAVTGVQLGSDEPLAAGCEDQFREDPYFLLCNEEA